MASKRWSVAVTDLTGTAHLHDLSVEADNWMSALRSGRARIGEEGGVPQGASCAVSPEGIVTILDPVSRRKFVLTQRQAIAEVPTPSAPAPAPSPQAAPVAATPVNPTPAATPLGTDPSTGKRRKFQTVAFDASTALAAQQTPHPAGDHARFQTVAFDAKSVAAANAQPPEPSPRPRSVPPNPLAPVSAAPAPVVPPAPAVPAFASAPAAPSQNANDPGKRRKFQTVAFDATTMAAPPAPTAAHPVQPITPRAPVAPVVSQPAPAPVAATPSVSMAPRPAPIETRSAAPVAVAPVRTAAPVAASAPVTQVQMLHQRSEDPTPKNPLTYRERSFVVQGVMTKSTLEAALFAELAKIKEEMAAAKRGKFVNLALFDHRWQERPLRPPVATLQWKDWKGDPELAFAPPPARASAPAPAAAAAHDDRLATAFEALQDLPFLSTAAEGLEFAVKLLGDLIPSQAVAACLYDINTDELRVVAAAGPGSAERKTQAIPVSAGLFGQGARAGDRALVFHDAQHEPEFDPGVDCAPGIEARGMLLRSLVQDGQLFGVMQLINRVNGQFTNEDVNVINYVAERVADFVRQAKLRGRL